MDHQGLTAYVDPSAIASMLYGSYARGDATPDSDVDLLQLHSTWQDHRQVERVSITTYTPSQLARMAEAGSLFILHLVTEGQVLTDPAGVLATALRSYQAPKSYRPLWLEIVAASRALDVDEACVGRNPIGFVRLGLYLLRTAAILRNLESSGEPIFSVPELAARLNAPALAKVFADRHATRSVGATPVATIRELIGAFTGMSARNPFLSLAALAINIEPPHPVAARLILGLIAGRETLGYGDLLLDPLVLP